MAKALSFFSRKHFVSYSVDIVTESPYLQKIVNVYVSYDFIVVTGRVSVSHVILTPENVEPN